MSARRAPAERRRARVYAVLAALLACSGEPSAPPGPPAPITTAERLRELVEALSHDSTRGRAAASSYEQSAAEYLVSHATRIGLLPRGENGTFLQTVPALYRRVDETSTASVDGVALAGSDVLVGLPPTATPVLSWDADAVWVGTYGGQNAPLPQGVDVRGRVAVVEKLPSGGTLTGVQTDAVLAVAAAVVFVVPAPFDPGLVGFLRSSRILHGPALRSNAETPVVLIVTREVAKSIMNAPLETLQPGQTGRRVRGNVVVTTSAATIRNVIAVLPGSDAGVAGEFIGLGAHYDHIGTGAGSAGDVVYNGADDNASGSAALVAIAEHFAQSQHRPRRSLAFMWWGAEEIGLVGSEWFAQSPTISPENMVAYVNLDMISRGGPTDIVGGGPAYLESIGSGRRSTQLTPIADSVASRHGFTLDYTLDAPGHKDRVFCRSDQWNLAKLGVPVVFFTTGVHQDYHRVTDEVSRSDFDKHQRVTTFVAGVTQVLASRAGGLSRDLAAPAPGAQCIQ